MTIAKWPRLTFFRGHKSSKNGTSTQRASGVNAVLSQLQGQSKVWQKNGSYPSHKTLGTTPHLALYIDIPSTSIVAKIRLKRGNYNYMCVTVF